jgi:hypothetical protein
MHILKIKKERVETLDKKTKQNMDNIEHGSSGHRPLKGV